MKHERTPMDKFFLAVPWHELEVLPYDLYMHSCGGRVIRSSKGMCPLQLATGVTKDYILEAKERFGLSHQEAMDIVHASDADGLNLTTVRELRRKMFQLIEGSKR